MIALGLIIKMLTHFPAEFCFPWSETKFSSGETQHAGEPPAQTPACWAHVSTAVRHTCQKHFKSQLEFAGCSCQDWSEGSKKHRVAGKSGLNFQTCIFTMRSCFLWPDMTLSLDYQWHKTPADTLSFTADQAANPSSLCKHRICSFGVAVTYHYRIAAKYSFEMLERWVGAHLVECKPGLTAHCQCRGNGWENKKDH